MNKNKIYTYLLLCLTAYNCIAFDSEEEEAARTLISFRNPSSPSEQQPPILLSPPQLGTSETILPESTATVPFFTTALSNSIEQSFEEEKDNDDATMPLAKISKKHANALFTCQQIGCRLTPTFSSQELLTEHIKTQHTDVKRICTYCGKSFAYASLLIKHIRTHTGKKPFSCATCSKSFSDLSHFIRHKRAHTGEKPFPCETCDKSFSRKDNLAKHSRIHTGEKTYKCATCSKSFSDSSHFIRHKRTHTGEKPFPCKTCDKSFSRKDALARHTRVHTDSRENRKRKEPHQDKAGPSHQAELSSESDESEEICREEDTETEE